MTYLDLIFENFWNSTVPIPIRYSAALKEKARNAWNDSLDDFCKHASTPEMVAPAIAFLQIGRILREAKLILEDNPRPDAVVNAIRSLIQRCKLSPPFPGEQP